MTYPIDTSKNWKFVTGKESVQFFSRRLEGSFNAAIPTTGKRMPLTKGELYSDASLQLNGVVWYLWTDLLPAGVEPKYSDRIQDAQGNKYQIIKIDIVSLLNRYRLVCLREVSQES